MSLKITVIIAALLAIIMLALFGQSIQKNAVTSIASSNSFSCNQDGICTSCMYKGASCSCEKEVCSCSNETIPRKDCMIGYELP